MIFQHIYQFIFVQIITYLYLAQIYYTTLLVLNLSHSTFQLKIMEESDIIMSNGASHDQAHSLSLLYYYQVYSLFLLYQDQVSSFFLLYYYQVYSLFLFYQDQVSSLFLLYQGSGVLPLPTLPGSGLLLLPVLPGSGLLPLPALPGSDLLPLPTLPGSDLLPLPALPGSCLLILPALLSVYMPCILPSCPMPTPFSLLSTLHHIFKKKRNLLYNFKHNLKCQPLISLILELQRLNI